MPGLRRILRDIAPLVSTLVHCVLLGKTLAFSGLQCESASIGRWFSQPGSDDSFSLWLSRWECGLPRLLPQARQPLPGLAHDGCHAEHVRGQVCGPLHREGEPGVPLTEVRGGAVWNRMLGWRSGSPEGMREVITVIHDMGEGYACLVWIQGIGVTQGRVLSL